MKINDKVVFKAATSDDKLLSEQGKRKEKAISHINSCILLGVLSFSPTKLQDSESNENALIIKASMTPGSTTLGNWIEFSINYLFGRKGCLSH